MNLRKNVVFATLTLGAIAATLTGQTQSRSGSHFCSAGNSYLGGSLSTSGGLSHTRATTYDSARAFFSLSGVGRLFGGSKEIAYLGASCSNFVSTSGQSRYASVTLRILGYNWGSSSTSGHSFRKYSYNLKLFPVDPRMSFGVGPITLTIKGNVGINASAAGGCLLPAGIPEVSLSASASMGAFATASVAASIPGFGVGVELRGDIGVQQLGMFARANPRSNILRGDAYYTLTAISLKLIGKAWALWYDWSTTLTSWSSTPFSKVLFAV